MERSARWHGQLLVLYILLIYLAYLMGSKCWLCLFLARLIETLNLLLSFYFSYMQIMLVSLWILKEKWKVLLSCNIVFYIMKPKYWWGKCTLLNAEYKTIWHVGANEPLYVSSWYTHGICWSYVAILKWVITDLGNNWHLDPPIGSRVYHFDL